MNAQTQAIRGTSRLTKRWHSELDLNSRGWNLLCTVAKNTALFILVVQTDEHLYDVSFDLTMKFENFFRNVLSRIHGKQSFSILGAHLVQDDSGTITITAQEKLEQIISFSGRRTNCGSDWWATEKELRDYWSVVQRPLYVGRLSSLAIAVHTLQSHQLQWTATIAYEGDKCHTLCSQRVFAYHRQYIV